MRILELRLPHATCRVVIGPLTPIRGPALIVCDRKVSRVARRLARGAPVLSIPSGESRKSVSLLAALWNEFARRGVDRRTTIAAVGGGVVGDLVGFAAATYLRGVPLVQVPTTLLAQVDAAIGGKTAINLAAGKNLAGAFYQPREVRIDPAALRTLPARHYRTGLAEVVKYGVIRDAELFELLERKADRVLARDPKTMQEIIHRCVRIKLEVVRRDERESGLRMILNYGHTVGHALERASNFRLSHGEAVAIGMHAEARIARGLGLCGTKFVERQARLLERFGLPTRVPRLGGILRAMAHDKKRLGRAIRFVLPRGVGRMAFPVAVARRRIDAVLS
jgi:3-dehydroquinate synthase